MVAGIFIPARAGWYPVETGEAMSERRAAAMTTLTLMMLGAACAPWPLQLDCAGLTPMTKTELFSAAMWAKTKE